MTLSKEELKQVLEEAAQSRDPGDWMAVNDLDPDAVMGLANSAAHAWVQMLPEMLADDDGDIHASAVALVMSGFQFGYMACQRQQQKGVVLQ